LQRYENVNVSRRNDISRHKARQGIVYSAPYFSEAVNPFNLHVTVKKLHSLAEKNIRFIAINLQTLSNYEQMAVPGP